MAWNTEDPLRAYKLAALQLCPATFLHFRHDFAEPHFHYSSHLDIPHPLSIKSCLPFQLHHPSVTMAEPRFERALFERLTHIKRNQGAAEHPATSNLLEP